MDLTPLIQIKMEESFYSEYLREQTTWRAKVWTGWWWY